MKTIKIDLSSPLDSTIIQSVVRVLESGGLICAPCCGTYRILADLMDARAVMNLVQSKRRTGKAPSLVFIDSEKRLGAVADFIEPEVHALASAFWPGGVTILVDPHSDIPSKVKKVILPGSARLGIRVPDDAVVQQICRAFGGPLLVSSANKARKHGEESPAQVRKTFLGKVDIMLDAGDLKEGHQSSVVDVRAGQVKVTRVGLISEEDIQAAVSPA